MKAIAGGVAVLALVAGAAGPAFAQLARGAEAVMSAAEARAALLGIDMQGHSPSFGFSWRECIDPEGVTLYETPAGVQHGRMVVIDNGLVCFSYEEDNYVQRSCYTVAKTRTGLLFEGDEDSIFLATHVVRGVKSCQPGDDLIG